MLPMARRTSGGHSLSVWAFNDARMSLRSHWLRVRPAAAAEACAAASVSSSSSKVTNDVAILNCFAGHCRSRAISSSVRHLMSASPVALSKRSGATGVWEIGFRITT